MPSVFMGRGLGSLLYFFLVRLAEPRCFPVLCICVVFFLPSTCVGPTTPIGAQGIYPPLLDYYSEDLRELARGMISTNPTKRPNAEEVFSNPFLQ